MSIIFLLILSVLWLAWPPQSALPAGLSQTSATLVFLGGYALAVLIVALRDRWFVRGLATGRAARLPRSARFALLARLFVMIWSAVGFNYLGWRHAVTVMLGPVGRWPVEFPGLVLGILPALLAWMGLWWAHYPVDRALYEQNLLFQLDADRPIYAPPSFGEYFTSKLRMQVLFTMTPVLMIVALRDLAGLIILGFGASQITPTTDTCATVVSVLLVILIAPEILRRVLATESLPDTELRRQLSSVAQRDRVRCRDLLLWRTHHTVGNAAVMGVVRWFRYVLLSDLLLESLPDEQVLAVFAHEVGHIIHRHMIWYVAFIFGVMLAMGSTADALTGSLHKLGMLDSTIDQTLTLLGLVVFLVSFGFLSRRFERQADVHAARTMQAMAEPTEGQSYVGVAGAAVFNSALLHVAEMNNMTPGVRGRFTGSLRHRINFLTEWLATTAGSWLHGTMASRMRYITRLSSDAALTRRFDRQMIRLRLGIIAMLLLCGLWTVYDARQSPNVPPRFQCN